MEKTLSVVVPAYNSEHFLGRVLDSLLTPETAEALEIIVVDDGSRDGTAALGRKYCAQWPGTVRLISQPNRGHGGALNTGIAAARGTYVRILDSDDWAETRNLLPLLEALKTCTCDVVLTPYRSVDVRDPRETLWDCGPAFHGRVWSLEDALRHWEDFHPLMALHGVTYRREFYCSLGLSLSEHVYYEDQEYVILPLCHARTLLPLDLLIYNYRVGDQNQSMSPANQKKNLGSYQAVLNRLLAEYPRLPPEEAGREFFCRMLKSFLMSFFLAQMLGGPRRRQGREAAAEGMEALRVQLPGLFSRLKLPYGILRLLSLLGVPGRVFDALLQPGHTCKNRKTTPQNKGTDYDV